MALDLNTNPYYDDFNEEKNFHRILFRPGYAVQARELTQMQTILQNQIKRFGSHILKDGSVVLGCDGTFKFDVPYVKVTNYDASSVIYTAPQYEALKSSLIGAIVSNATGVTAKIVRVDEDTLGQKVLYLNYQTASPSSNSSVFSDGDTLSIDSNRGFKAISSSATGTGSLFTLGDGIVFAEGTFVNNYEQTFAVDYFSSTPSQQVGFRVVDTIVASGDDSTLLDPAYGSYNYAAPGANRYKLSTELVRYGIDETPDEGFYLLFLVVDGQVARAFNKPQYAELQKTLAERTFDESGNYSVNGLNVNIREHIKTATNNGKYAVGAGGDSSKLVYGIEPGKAYVEGYEVELNATHYTDVDKAIDTATYTNKSVSTSFGNYVLVKNLTGSWNIDENPIVALCGSGGITNPVSTARVRLVQFHSGAGAGHGTAIIYKMYFYDIQSIPYASDSVESIIDTANANNTCEIVDSFRLYDSGFNSFIFPTGEKAVSSYTDGVDFYYWKKFSSVTFTGGTTATITCDATEEWPSTGSLTSDLVAQHFHIVDNASSYYPLSTTISCASGTAASATITTSGASSTYTIFALVKINNKAAIHKTLDQTLLKFDGSVTKYTFASADVNISTNTITVTGHTFLTGDAIIYSNGGGTSVQAYNAQTGNDVLSQTNTYYVIKTGTNTLKLASNAVSALNGDFIDIIDAGVGTSHSLTQANVANKRIYLGVSDGFDLVSVHMASSVTTFPATETWAGWTDVTSDFTYVTNQGDNTYNTSYIDYTGSDDLTTKRLVIKHRYFKRDYDTGFMTVGSYPLPSQNSTPSASQIDWYQIPIYKSSTTGITYDLRDAVDFRPAYTNRSGFELKSISAAPVLTVTQNVPSATLPTGIFVTDANGQLTTTFSYNLPRIDKAIITRDGEFKVLTGTSSLVPQEPNDETHAMTLATISLAPYPSLSTYVAKKYGREDYASVVRLADNRRYTMKDIGNIEQRLSRLEYFATLSAVESKAANVFIDDGSGGNMVKKGILVDTFDGHGVGNIFDPHYNIAIDAKKKELRPAFTLENINFIVTGTVNQIGDVIVSDFNGADKALITNAAASKSRICGSTLLGNYSNGILYLNPAQDMWLDTEARPDVQSNFNNTNDGWEFDNTPFNIHWNGWQNIWQGIKLSTLSNINVTMVNGITGTNIYNQSTQFVSDITRSIVVSGQLPESNMRIIGLKVVDVSVVPFIREQVITFIASSILPNAKVKAYFDGEDVTEYCRTFDIDTAGITVDTIKTYADAALLSRYETNASAYGDDIIVSTTGVVVGQFKVPANTFRTGSRVFKLVDDSNVTQSAFEFHASGLAQISNSSITSTRFAEPRQDTLEDTQNGIMNRLVFSNASTWNPTSYGDPMAQTFIVEGQPDGTFITKVDMYFQAKSSTKNITVQLRDVVNGFPGSKIVPFSTKTLTPDSVNISDDASEATTFTFDSPVYLKNSTEYALVILPENNTTEYVVWVSELGQNSIGTTQKISQQPHVGVLYIPNNNTEWTSLDAEDLKFNLYHGQFSTTQKSITFKSAPIDYVTGSGLLDVGDYVTVSSTYSGVVTQIESDGTHHIYRLTGRLVDGNTLTASSTHTLTSCVLHNKQVTALAPNFGTLTTAPSTDITWSYKLKNGTGSQDNSVLFKNGETLELGATRTIFSYSYPTYGENDADTAAIELTATLNNNIASTTPVIDIRKMSMLTINNVAEISLTGTVTLMSATKLVGDCTLFRTELQVGDLIMATAGVSTGYVIGEVARIESDTELYFVDTDAEAYPYLVDITIAKVNSIYVTRAVTLENDTAEDLRVYLDVKKTEDTQIMVYAKMQSITDNRMWENVPWTLLTEVPPTVINRLIHQEYAYTVYSPYTYSKFAVRIVMTDTDSSKVSTVKNLRAIALI